MILPPFNNWFKRIDLRCCTDSWRMRVSSIHFNEWPLSSWLIFYNFSFLKMYVVSFEIFSWRKKKHWYNCCFYSWRLNVWILEENSKYKTGTLGTHPHWSGRKRKRWHSSHLILALAWSGSVCVSVERAVCSILSTSILHHEVFIPNFLDFLVIL